MPPKAETPGEKATESSATSNAARSPLAAEELVLLVARLMEGGQDDDDMCKTLDGIARLLSVEKSGSLPENQVTRPLHEFVDSDMLETILACLDMRSGEIVRGHARLTISAYLKASGQTGTEYLSEFFKSRVSKATYDDFIVAFSVAAYIFPIVPDISASLFLSEGFVNSLGPLMKRKWKSRKVERACLEMLDAACMNTACRDTIRMHCTEWLVEILAESTSYPREVNHLEHHIVIEDGPLQQRVHSENVRLLAAVILAKLEAAPRNMKPGSNERIQPALTSMDDLVERFTEVLDSAEKDHLMQQTSIEGLMVASSHPKIKDELASDPVFLKNLLNVLSTSLPTSPTTYASLAVLDNLTKFSPTMTNDQVRMTQLQAYANASPSSSEPDPLEASKFVFDRGIRVFNAGFIPVLVTHSQKGSRGSVKLIVSIFFSLSNNKDLRGSMIQQGAIKLLIRAYYDIFDESEPLGRRLAAHALSRLLITTNPEHTFGSPPPHMTTAVRPLVSLLQDDLNTERVDRLPAFEGLLALTNLASTNDLVRNAIIRVVFDSIDNFLWSENLRVVRATTELICNLVQSEEGVAKFADGKQPSHRRFRILVALAGAIDIETRCAVGGALAAMTQWDAAANWIIWKEVGIPPILALVIEDREDLRHRGICIVLNLLRVTVQANEWGLQMLRKYKAYETVKEGLEKGGKEEVVELMEEALKILKE